MVSNTILDYDKYISYRYFGYTPLQLSQDKSYYFTKEGGLGIKSLINVVLGIVSFVVVDEIVEDLLKDLNITLWITSPSGNTTIELPISVALRIIRKRKWLTAKCYPVELTTPEVANARL
jgi:hypothetical protein